MNIVQLTAHERIDFGFIFGLWWSFGCLCTIHRHHVVGEYRRLHSLHMFAPRMYNLDRRS